MEKMFSPWRSQYISSFAEVEKKDPNACFLCDAAKNSGENDHDLLVCARKKNCFVIMNRFPYNGGHIMVVPYRHIAEFEEITTDELTEIMLTIQESISALKKIFSPHGFNIGANLGRVAGAGVPGHIHFHIVPRWNGDTNFMPVLAEIKVVSESLEDFRDKIASALSEGGQK